MKLPSAPQRRDALALLVGAALLPAVARADTGIDESKFVWLGGLRQWIGIKGKDRANPLLLVVHGGPGDVQWPYEDRFAPWEENFTVVQWDQRGAGRTFARNGKSTPDVNLDRIVKDGLELADTLKGVLGKNKIILLGHSWGSMVAALMAAARPDLFAAYVGTGQVESWKVMVQSQFDLILAHARAVQDTATIKELEAIGTPDPTNTHQYFTFSRNFRSLWAQTDQDWIKTIIALMRAHPNDKDWQAIDEGQLFTDVRVLPDQVKTDLAVQAAHIGTDVVIIQGADDVITPTKGAEDYFNRLDAPHKELVLIPGAGHFAYLTHGAQFLAALTGKVRPLAIANGA